MSLTQKEFEYIIQLQKQFKENDQILLDSSWSRDIISLETKDTFILHYTVSSIDIKKFSYHKTYKKIIPLLRFDFKRHTNPDGTVFEGAHVHIYQEGYDDKFAFSISKLGINENNLEKDEVLKCFLKYCNVLEHPIIKSTLF